MPLNAPAPAKLVTKSFQPVRNSAYWRTLAPLLNEDSREILISLPGGFTVERWQLSEAETQEVAERSHIVSVVEEGYAAKPPPPPQVFSEAVSMTLEEALRWHEVQYLHQAGLEGQGQIIAVLDTGISKELAAKLSAEGRLAGAISLVPEEDAYDEGAESGHGTFCCEAVATMAPKAKILSLKVLSSREGWGYSSWIIKGYSRAKDYGASVASASLGGPGDPTDAMSQTVDACSKVGVLCASAAGNEQRDTTEYMADRSHPACAAESFTIGAFDSDKELAYFSNWGKCLRAAALGVRITQGGRDWSGTSMATPIAAGIAACVRGFKEPRLTVEETKTLLYKSSIDSEYDPWKEGYGLLNGELIADLLDLGPPPEGYYSKLQRQWYMRPSKYQDVDTVLTKRNGSEMGVFFPKRSGA